jgi:hypothetical protein
LPDQPKGAFQVQTVPYLLLDGFRRFHKLFMEARPDRQQRPDREAYSWRLRPQLSTISNGYLK